MYQGLSIKYDKGKIVNRKPGIQLQSPLYPASNRWKCIKLFTMESYVQWWCYAKKALSIKELNRRNTEVSTGQKEDYILLLHLSVIRIFLFLDEPTGLDVREDYPSTNKSSSNRRERQSCLASHNMAKLKPYVTALPFWIMERLSLVLLQNWQTGWEENISI